MVVISEDYDAYLDYLAADLCPIFVPITHEGREALYVAVIVPTPNQRRQIRENQSQWLLRSIEAIRNMAAERGYRKESE
jgi:hypothetical protein